MQNDAFCVMHHKLSIMQNKSNGIPFQAVIGPFDFGLSLSTIRSRNKTTVKQWQLQQQFRMTSPFIGKFMWSTGTDAFRSS